MKPGKDPGPGGLIRQYYKCFEDQLLQPVKDIMNGVLQGAKMLQNWQEANIALLLKKGARCQDKNHRLMSSLNNEYKLFAAILAEGLKKVLQTYIHED